MAFESLSRTCTFRIADFPEEWLPLLFLYDPDLPLYPLVYFHCIDPALAKGERPGETDRVFGFVHHLNLGDSYLDVTVAINKDLDIAKNERYKKIVEDEVKARLGFSDPVTLDQLRNSFTGKLKPANRLIEELWYQIVDQSFGKSLPFGQMWDPVYGLVRFIASWNSEGGRKGELIQAHYFASAFGEHIQTDERVHADFYLLPTFQEFSDQDNPLNRFPKFAELMDGAIEFCSKYCLQVSVGKHKFSGFSPAKAKAGTKIKTSVVLELINREAGKRRHALFENYSAFNRGPQRSILALMMFADLRRKMWKPDALGTTDCAEMYTAMKGTYQSSKVIQLYAQQCFGAQPVLPIDNWVKTFVEWPFDFHPAKLKDYYSELFACAPNWGKIERLVWLAAQARKVHASICAEILWCIRYGGREKAMRGASPTSCKICQTHIRKVCPAYAAIAARSVSFNSAAPKGGFSIETSSKNNTAPAQTIVSSSSSGTYDEYSTRDRPNEFKPFPLPGHKGEDMTVEAFIARY